MNIELSGWLALVFNICVLTTAICIILLGAWCIFNYIIWEILMKYALIYLGLYKDFAHFIKYKNRYIKWAKKYEGKTEEGAND